MDKRTEKALERSSNLIETAMLLQSKMITATLRSVLNNVPDEIKYHGKYEVFVEDEVENFQDYIEEHYFTDYVIENLLSLKGEMMDEEVVLVELYKAFNRHNYKINQYIDMLKSRKERFIRKNFDF